MTQANLLEKCPEHLSPHGTGVTGADVLGTMQRWASEYNACAARQRALVESVK